MASAAIWLLTLTALMVDGHSTITTHHGYPDEANCRAAGSITASHLSETGIKSGWTCLKVNLETLSLSEAIAAYSPAHKHMVPYRERPDQKTLAPN